jgi:hypothetical protein
VGERWLTDFDRVTRHENWFFHLDGRRVRQTQWNWYLMNPSSGWRLDYEPVSGSIELAPRTGAVLVERR